MIVIEGDQVGQIVLRELVQAKDQRQVLLYPTYRHSSRDQFSNFGQPAKTLKKRHLQNHKHPHHIT